jgi:hypothetical protein
MAAGAYVLPMIFLCLAILLVAQASITIQSYSSTGKAKDTNYYWTAFVLFLAIIGLFASFYMLYKASKGQGVFSGGGAAGELLSPVDVKKLGTSGDAKTIDALRAKLEVNKGAINSKLTTELATKLAQLEQARRVLEAYTAGASAAVTTTA